MENSVRKRIGKLDGMNDLRMCVHASNHYRK
jgi:hypothetical protein